MAGLEEDDKALFREEYGIEKSGLDQLVSACYDLLGLFADVLALLARFCTLSISANINSNSIVSISRRGSTLPSTCVILASSKHLTTWTIASTSLMCDKKKLGVVGLPNVGKSTLFNAITQAGAESANYPFCTIEPNVGVVAVPDERLDLLASIFFAFQKSLDVVFVPYNDKRPNDKTANYCRRSVSVNYGSGNPGTMNVMRSIGKVWGALTFAFDCAKGVAFALIGKFALNSADWMFIFQISISLPQSVLCNYFNINKRLAQLFE